MRDGCDCYGPFWPFYSFIIVVFHAFFFAIFFLRALYSTLCEIARRVVTQLTRARPDTAGVIREQRGRSFSLPCAERAVTRVRNFMAKVVY